MPDEERLAAILSGHIGALATLVGLLIEKGVLTPADVINHFNRAASTALSSDGGASAAQASQAIVDFVRRETGTGRLKPS
jgi:hypothetical protein